ncbi:hypothetical protein [Archaeoglobus neptunius]|uniref:hypothetical protein n=1 Tax=Archaeoglobus neptunius TaxID=2798580 RepID=UPI001927EACB|nr:hypothetical protein [Archaeoglobus neptunius]
MPWGMGYTQSDFWLGLLVGFGIMAAIMLIGFYMLMRSVSDMKTSISRMESRIENVGEKVEKIVEQLEEI